MTGNSWRHALVLGVLFTGACGGSDDGGGGGPQPGRYRLTANLPTGRASWDYVEVSSISDRSIFVRPGSPDFDYSDGYPSERRGLPYGISGTGYMVIGHVAEGSVQWFLQPDGNGFNCTILELNGAAGGQHECSFTRTGP